MLRSFEMLTVIEAIENRRSIRKYKTDQVPDEVILELLKSARLAPSAHNSQPWRFVVLKDYGVKKEIRKYAYGLQFVESAPCIIVCCVDLGVHTVKATRRRLKELQVAGVLDDVGQVTYDPLTNIADGDSVQPWRFLESCRFNSAIATTHIVLAALAFGLSTCWIHMFEPEKVHELLKLPDNIAVVSILTLGYPDQDPPPRPRLPLESLILTPITQALALGIQNLDAQSQV
jgi:nitroreductase